MRKGEKSKVNFHKFLNIKLHHSRGKYDICICGRRRNGGGDRYVPALERMRYNLCHCRPLVAVPYMHAVR